jgi:hypothetical protein
MDEKKNDLQLVEEIRALRADLRRYAVIAMWLFLGACVCGLILFSNHASNPAIEGLISVLIVIGFAWLVGLILQAAFNAKLRRQREHAESSILSARIAASSRRPSGETRS